MVLSIRGRPFFIFFSPLKVVCRLLTIRMPPRLVQTRRALLGEAGLALGGPLLLICFFSVRSPVSANAQECAPGKKEQKKPYRYRRPPRLAALEIIERCVRVCRFPCSCAAAAGGSSGRVRSARPQ